MATRRGRASSVAGQCQLDASIATALDGIVVYLSDDNTVKPLDDAASTSKFAYGILTDDFKAYDGMNTRWVGGQLVSILTDGNGWTDRFDATHPPVAGAKLGIVEYNPSAPTTTGLLRAAQTNDQIVALCTSVEGGICYFQWKA